MDAGHHGIEAGDMSASLTLLLVVLFLAAIAVAGPRWGADTRSPGGWNTSRHPAPLWPGGPARGVSVPDDLVDPRR